MRFSCKVPHFLAMAIGFSQVDSAFSTSYFSGRIKERARRGWESTQIPRRPARPGRGPQNPEKAQKKSESILVGDVRRANPHPWLLVMPVLLLIDASDAGD